jgi:TolB-like protein/DNA-binding winged helix-turn-helix (wHTH) protein/Tfp pilus assembly protein PilF
MAETLPSRVVHFGDFAADLHTGELRKNGIKIKLQEKPFQILASLLEHPGELITREALREKLWPADTFVDFDHSLGTAIGKLRQALGDSAQEPRFVETVSSRGYRFIGSVSPANQPTPAPLTSTAILGGEVMPGPAAKTNTARRLVVRLAFGLIGGALLIGIALEFNMGGVRRWMRRQSDPPVGSLAVLPLENLSGDPAQDYFADGMTDAVITVLAKIGALRVVSRTSVMRYKRTQKSVPEIAKELHVDALVEGSIEHRGNRVRISAQLIRAATDRHIWAESYDREASDVLRVQEEIARSIAREIQVKLTPQEQALLTKGRPVDPQAYELYLKGRYFWTKSTKESIATAIGLFQEAIARDPTYASPYSGLADCYTVLGVSFGVASLSPTQAVSQGRAAAEKAIQLDETMAEGHNSLANTKFLFDWDWVGSEAEFKRALELNPGYADAHHWYAHLLAAEGRLDLALAESKRALDLDQLSRVTNLHLGWQYIYSRQYDQAIEQLRKTLELDPGYGYAYWYMARAYEQQGKYSEALQAMRKAEDLLKGNTAVAADIGHLSAVSGDRATALKVLKQLGSVPKGPYVSPMEIALIYVALDRKTEAFQWFEKAYAERSDLLIYANVDPRLDSMRSDPRFQNLLRRIGFTPPA